MITKYDIDDYINDRIVMSQHGIFFQYGNKQTCKTCQYVSIFLINYITLLVLYISDLDNI